MGLKTPPDPCKNTKWSVSSNFGNVHYNCSRLKSCKPYVNVEEHTVEVEEHIGKTPVNVLFSLVV